MWLMIYILHLSDRRGSGGFRVDTANVSSSPANDDDNRDVAFAPSCFAIGNATRASPRPRCSIDTVDSCGTDAPVHLVTFSRRRRLSLPSLPSKIERSGLCYFRPGRRRSSPWMVTSNRHNPRNPYLWPSVRHRLETRTISSCHVEMKRPF